MRILSTLRGLLRQTPVTNGRLEGDMDANGQRIVNVGEPTLDDDAATKKYVDDHGGGGGSVVESATNPGFAANADRADLATTASMDVFGNLIVDTYAQFKDLAVNLDLTGDGTPANPYEIKLDGFVVSFSRLKLFAQTRNAVIHRGQGTYRVTYIGATEMMWDVTGSVAGNVQTGQIHIFDIDGETVVQRVEPKVLATKAMSDAAQAAADGALGFSTYPIKAVVNGQLLDRTVNTSAGGAFSFPARVTTGARDFVVVVAASATAPSVSFPSSGVTYFSDDDAVWTAEADKVNIWYFTEIAANQFMVAHKALAATTQA